MLLDNTFNKFNKYIYFPDLYYKHLSIKYHNSLARDSVYLKYIFTDRAPLFNPFPMKAIVMLESVYPKRVESNASLILLKFGKARTHSTIYLKLNLKEFFGFISLFMIKPFNTRVLKSYLSSSKYFIFPGFTPHLRVDPWDRYVQLSVNSAALSTKYSFLFHKTSYLE